MTQALQLAFNEFAITVAAAILLRRNDYVEAVARARLLAKENARQRDAEKHAEENPPVKPVWIPFRKRAESLTGQPRPKNARRCVRELLVAEYEDRDPRGLFGFRYPDPAKILNPKSKSDWKSAEVDRVLNDLEVNGFLSSTAFIMKRRYLDLFPRRGNRDLKKSLAGMSEAKNRAKVRNSTGKVCD